MSALMGRSNLFRVLVEHTSDIITVVSGDGTITYQSPSCRRVLGYDPDELVGTSSFALIHSDDLAWASSMFNERIAVDGLTPPVRIRLRHRNGSWVWLEAVGNNLIHEPDVAGMVISSRDISAQVRAEQALHESQQWLETVVSGAPIVLFAFDHHGVFTLSAGSALAALGTTPGREVGRSMFELYASTPSIEAAARRALAGERFQTIIDVNGLAWAIEFGPLRNAMGDIVGGVGVATDITKARRAQHKTAALLELARVISAASNLDELLGTVHQWIASTLHCDLVATYTRDLESGLVRLHGRFPLLNHDPALGTALPRDAAFVACLERGETIVRNDATAVSLGADPDCEPGMRSVLMTPLQVRGSGLGVMVMARKSAPFGDDDAELSKGVAGQLAVAIERAQLDRAREVEAQVMAAIARVGQELISCLDTPALVDRLCRVTAEVLRCDVCDTRLWDPAQDAFVLVAEYGVSSEEHEALRPISIPRSMVPLEGRDLWHGRTEEIASAQLAALARQLGISAGMTIPLRRGEQLIGLQGAAIRNREGSFSASQVQIARAIGQLAAMALENARLVEELQHASRLKSEFVATMSHELRTPLNVIIGYTDLLIEESFGPLSTEQRQVCRRVERSAEELLELINATLDLGRLEAGRLPLDLQQVSVAEVAASVEEETRERCTKPNLAVKWRVAKGVPSIRTDPLKLKVILKNLIANAIKFTPAGEVEVTIDAREFGVEIRVRDTGIGIAADMQSIIFEPFRQGDGSTSRRFGGVGLGLYIVRRLVEVLGGMVSVTSEVGQGSTFHVYLPSNQAQ